MQLEDDHILGIAQLAKLAVTEHELPAYRRDLTNILNLVDEMNSVDTSDIAPMAHPLNAQQRLRDDQVTETNRRETFQAIAPAVEDGLYLVPRVIE